MHLRILNTKSVFLLGFCIGFFIALLLSLAQNAFTCATGCDKPPQYRQTIDKHAVPNLLLADDSCMDKEVILQNWVDTSAASVPRNVSYDSWIARRHLQIKSVDEDEYLYGADKSVQLESEWLKSRVHVTCVVFVKKVKLAKSIWDTWGKRCNRIYFFGQHLKDSEVPVIDVKVKLLSSWQHLCEAMKHIWHDSRLLEWIIFVKDDTVVIPENLRYMVSPLNHTQDHYLGHAVVMWGQPYNVAQAGYVLSQGSLQKIVSQFNSSEKCAAGGKYWKKEDYYLAKHLSSMGIRPSDTRDQYLRGTFHGYSLQNLLWGIMRPGSYWTHALYPTQEKCCSPISVTFSAGEPDKMYTLDYLLYHLHVLRSESTFGARNAPTPVPEEEVWRIALKEEFNMTILNEMSSEAYYEIWHSKYSEPQQLIAKNYQSMPDVLSSVLTAYELESKSMDKSTIK